MNDETGNTKRTDEVEAELLAQLEVMRRLVMPHQNVDVVFTARGLAALVDAVILLLEERVARKETTP